MRACACGRWARTASMATSHQRWTSSWPSKSRSMRPKVAQSQRFCGHPSSRWRTALPEFPFCCCSNQWEWLFGTIGRGWQCNTRGRCPSERPWHMHPFRAFRLVSVLCMAGLHVMTYVRSKLKDPGTRVGPGIPRGMPPDAYHCLSCIGILHSGNCGMLFLAQIVSAECLSFAGEGVLGVGDNLRVCCYVGLVWC